MKIESFLLSLVIYITLAENRLNTALNGSETKDCPLECQPGFYCIQNETKWECGACPSGRFTDKLNSMHACKACRPNCYGANEIITTECKPDSDIECGCDKKYFHEKAGTGSSKCLPLRECVVGLGVDKAATAISDVTCIECVDGTNFSSIISSYETCQPCRNCEKEGFNETKECTRSSNADCFRPIPTTSSSSTTEGTTTADDSSEGKTGDFKAMLIIVGVIVSMIAIALLIYFGRRYWLDKKNPNKYSVSEERTDTNSNDVIVGIDEGPGDTSTRTTRSQQKTRRRVISNLFLEQDIILENDVFPWLSTQLGNEYVRICKLLPGSSVERRISKADIDAATFKCQSIGGLQDVIAEVLLTWQNKNTDVKNKDELFNDIYSTLYNDEGDMRAIAMGLRSQFAR